MFVYIHATSLPGKHKRSHVTKIGDEKLIKDFQLPLETKKPIWAEEVLDVLPRNERITGDLLENIQQIVLSESIKEKRNRGKKKDKDRQRLQTKNKKKQKSYGRIASSKNKMQHKFEILLNSSKRILTDFTTLNKDSNLVDAAALTKRYSNSSENRRALNKDFIDLDKDDHIKMLEMTKKARIDKLKNFTSKPSSLKGFTKDFARLNIDDDHIKVAATKEKKSILAGKNLNGKDILEELPDFNNIDDNIEMLAMTKTRFDEAGKKISSGKNSNNKIHTKEQRYFNKKDMDTNLRKPQSYMNVKQIPARKIPSTISIMKGSVNFNEDNDQVEIQSVMKIHSKENTGKNSSKTSNAKANLNDFDIFNNNNHFPKPMAINAGQKQFFTDKASKTESLFTKIADLNKDSDYIKILPIENMSSERVLKKVSRRKLNNSQNLLKEIANLNKDDDYIEMQDIMKSRHNNVILDPEAINTRKAIVRGSDKLAIQDVDKSSEILSPQADASIKSPAIKVLTGNMTLKSSSELTDMNIADMVPVIGIDMTPSEMDLKTLTSSGHRIWNNLDQADVDLVDMAKYMTPQSQDLYLSMNDFAVNNKKYFGGYFKRPKSKDMWSTREIPWVGHAFSQKKYNMESDNSKQDISLENSDNANNGLWFDYHKENKDATNYFKPGTGTLLNSDKSASSNELEGPSTFIDINELQLNSQTPAKNFEENFLNRLWLYKNSIHSRLNSQNGKDNSDNDSKELQERDPLEFTLLEKKEKSAEMAWHQEIKNDHLKPIQEETTTTQIHSKTYYNYDYEHSEENPNDYYPYYFYYD